MVDATASPWDTTRHAPWLVRFRAISVRPWFFPHGSHHGFNSPWVRYLLGTTMGYTMEKDSVPWATPWCTRLNIMACAISHERLRTDYREDAFPGASHRNRILVPKRLITVGGVWKIVHDVPTGQPTVAKPPNKLLIG